VSTSTDTPTLAIGSFDVRDDKVHLRAKTTEGLDVEFLVDPMALAIMSLTMDGALRFALAKAREQGQAGPTPPVAPDSPEGLEG
jgi:hypothetical protein